MQYRPAAPLRVFGGTAGAVIVPLVLGCLFAAVGATGPGHPDPPLLPLRGTFLDVQYDGRLKYANNVTLALSCQGWEGKIFELAAFGIDFIIFQAVHDDRFGAYYNSSLHPAWRGACPDVVGTVMRAAARAAIKIWLSCEFTHTDEDGVVAPELMRGRHAIMSELVHAGYTELPSFHGWYFSSEAYLTSTDGCGACFPSSFMTYIDTMANWSRTLTPGARRFVSPFGTRSAVATPAFVQQLQALDVDVVAYQDEVGCIRDSLPVAQSERSFRQLQLAHSHPGTPALWANIESFTWAGDPNSVDSALIPAPFPRILAQLAAVAPYVDLAITFTCEAMYQPPPVAGSPPEWGPPAARREWDAYVALFGGPSPPSTRLEVESIRGAVRHQGIGSRVTYPSDDANPDPAMATGSLSDGLTGFQSPFDARWVGFKPGKDAVVVVELPADVTWPLESLAASFLAVPPLHFTDGDHTQPVARNVTAWLPQQVAWSLGPTATGPWHNVDQVAKTDWWEREVYDIRTQLYWQNVSVAAAVTGQKFLRMVARSAAPPWWNAWYNLRVKTTPGGLRVGRLMLDEIIVNRGL